MKYNRPIAITIAGFDPTGGAGVLADVKTFEQHRVLGMSVLTGTTIQTESEFLEVNWFSAAAVIRQLEPLLENYQTLFFKIGIVSSLEMLEEIVVWLKTRIPDCQLVWDPVLAASSGFELHDAFEKDTLIRILKQIQLITPNVPEVRKLAGLEDEIEAAFHLGKYTNVLLKGGHSAVREGIDLLIQNGVPQEIPTQIQAKKQAKHGSGCILSSAITANLALGKALPEACLEAKKYIEERLASNPNLLAYHVA